MVAQYHSDMNPNKPIVMNYTEADILYLIFFFWAELLALFVCFYSSYYPPYTADGVFLTIHVYDFLFRFGICFVIGYWIVEQFRWSRVLGKDR